MAKLNLRLGMCMMLCYMHWHILGGASGITVDVFPRSPIVRVGQNFTFMCRVGRPLSHCGFVVPGFDFRLSISEATPKNTNYWYAGDGLRTGQCGITMARIEDKNNGEFRCSLAFQNEQRESDGFTMVTVARAPVLDPMLVVTPEADRNLRAYNEDTTIQAMCTVRDVRPAADILWYMGDDLITEGLSRLDTVEAQNNLFTVQQNLTRKLSWKDNGKNLRCMAKHIALDDRPKQTIKQISVRFAPRPRNGQMEQFGFIVGEEGIITVQIYANPRPSLTWTVDYESIPEGNMETTQRFQAKCILEMGNSTWIAVLRILRVTAEDVEKKYVLRARNDVGEQQYTVMISTSAAPEGSVELGTGPIIGIVVGILVLLIVVFMLIFARATGRWCFSVP